MSGYGDEEEDFTIERQRKGSESRGNIGYGDRAYTPIPFLEHEFDEEHTSSRDS